jgi:class 3 adenylate cyclase
MLLQAGDREGADRALARLEEAVRLTRDPQQRRLLNFARLVQAFLDGDLELAAAVQEEGSLIPFEMRHFGPPLLLLGRYEEAVDSVRLTYRSLGAGARGLLASVLARTGATDEARTLLQDAFAAGREDAGWGTGLATALLDTALLLGEREIAGRLAEHLVPAANVPSVPFANASVGRVLGDEAALRGAPTEARRFYEQALLACRKIRRRPEVATVRFRLARLLLEHYPDERDQALEHLAFAIGEFQQMKMAPSLEEAMRLRFSLQGLAGGDPNSSIVAVSRLAQAERPDLTLSSASDGSITLMFTDIENSTALTERLGDARWIDLLREHNAAVEREVEAHGGKVVKNRGDGYMLTFSQPERGLDCAAAIQRALAGHEIMRVRIGLHTGNPVKEGDDFFGTDVNFAARVADRALGGQVLVSARLYDLLKGDHRERFGEPVDVEFKGFAGSHRVYALARA